MEIQFTPKINFFIPAGGDCKDCEEEARLKEQQETSETGENADRATLSGDSQASANADRVTLSAVPGTQSLAPAEEETSKDRAPKGGTVPSAEQQLSEEERQALEQLRARDREVRAHEQAHVAAAGGFARGGPKFEYQTGPDGKRYAVGGEVSIDTSPVPGNPQATISKAQVIRRAANAPRNPSGQDRQVAAQATRLEAEARQELNQQRAEEAQQAREKIESGPTTLNASKTSQESETTDTQKGPTAERNNGTTARRVIEKYTPGTTTASGLLSIIA